MVHLHRHDFNRRMLLQTAGAGFGAIALAHLQQSQHSVASEADSNWLSASNARVKRVVWLFMHGGPSHVDLFDPKPELDRLAGSPVPESFGMFRTRRNVSKNPLLASVKPFHKRGNSGLEISEFLSETAKHADDLCIIRSMHGDSVNHPQSVYQMNTGSILMGRPSVGSWVSYGLGSENEDLPAFIVLPDPAGGIKGGPPAWGSGFLPTTYQGVAMRAGDQPILNLKLSREMSSQEQRDALNIAQFLNEQHRQSRLVDEELNARINAYELAFRMQATAPELVDISQETEATQKLYGLNNPDTQEFGRRCLYARRMLERGVRFVQVYSGDTNGWDAHSDVLQNHTEYCQRTDVPVAALLTDLKQRGLWDDTLVIWGGEFGRMPMSESGKGRDHNPWGYSVWLSGGAVKGGMAYGATDEIGLRAVEKPVHVRNFHATLLYLLGIDPHEFSFYHNGLDERLIGPTDDVEIISEILS